MNTSLTPFLFFLVVAGAAGTAQYYLPGPLESTRFRRWALAGLMLIFVMTALVPLRLMTPAWKSHVIDTSLIINCLWNTAQGRLWMSDLSGMNILGLHSFFNVILLTPIAALLPMPHGLLAFQPAYLILSALIVHRLGVILLKDPAVAATMAMVFLLYPPMAGWSHGAIHPGNLAVPFFLAALVAAESDRSVAFIIWLLLGAASWEASLFCAPMIALAVGIQKPSMRRSAWIVGILSLVLLLVYFLLVQPHFTRNLPPVSLNRHYSALGNTPKEILRRILMSPASLIPIVFIRGKIGFICHLLLPWLGIPLLAPTALLGLLPELALILLCNPGDDMYRVDCFYTQVTTVILTWATLRGLRRLRELLPGRPRLTGALATALLVFGLGLQLCYPHTLGNGLTRLGTGLRAPAEPWPRPLSVPEGARVIVTHGGLADLLPRQRVVFPDPFMAPVACRNLAEGHWAPEYLVCLIDDDDLPLVKDLAQRYQFVPDGDSVPPSIVYRLEPR